MRATIKTSLPCVCTVHVSTVEVLLVAVHGLGKLSKGDQESAHFHGSECDSEGTRVEGNALIDHAAVLRDHLRTIQIYYMHAPHTGTYKHTERFTMADCTHYTSTVCMTETPAHHTDC